MNVRILTAHLQSLCFKIRLFAVFWRIQQTYVISLIFVKKVLTKHDIVCYNNQAVSETEAAKSGRASSGRTLKTIQRKREREAKLRRSGEPGSEEAEREKREAAGREPSGGTRNSQNSMSKTPRAKGKRRLWRAEVSRWSRWIRIEHQSLILAQDERWRRA